MRLHKQILTLAICGMAVACTSDKDEMTPSQMAGATLSFTSLMGDTSGTLSQGDVVGITLWDDVNGQRYTINNRLLVAEGGELVSEEEITYPQKATSVSVFAYMPYTTDWNSAEQYHRVEVSTDQSNYENYHNSDLLIGKPVNGNPITATNVKLAFNHAMSRINIEILDPSETVGLAGATVKITNIYTSAFINPYTEEVTTIEGQTGGVIAYRTLGAAKTRSNRRETLAAIIPPQTVARGEALIEINIDSEKYRFLLPDSLTLGSSSSYNYSMELSEGTLRLVSSYVTGWTTGDETSVYVDDDEVTPDSTQRGERDANAIMKLTQ